MTNQFTIKEAIAQYENKVEDKYTTDGKVNRSDVWTFTNLLTATEVLLAVATENDNDEEYVELLEKLANLEGGIERVIYDIVKDNYILGDWMSNTDDYHEYSIGYNETGYNEGTMDIVSNVVKLLSE